MSKADELRTKNENLFERNAILLNENERLKKENAELKEQHKVDLRQIQAILNQRSIQNTKLTKAKEIMQELIHEISVFYIATDRTVVSPTVKEAEQFLKEIEK